MDKFIALVRNENLKVRRRKTILIMTVILVVVSFLFSAIIGLANREISQWGIDDSYSLEEDCRTQLAYYREIEAEGNTSVFTKQKIAYYSMLIDIHATQSDWRYTTDVVTIWSEAKSRGDEETADPLEKIIRENDCFSYYAYKIAQNERDLTASYATAVNEGYRYCIDHRIAPDDWRYETAMKLGTLSLQLLYYDEAREAGYTVGEANVEKLKNDYALAEYRLAHNTDDYFSNDVFSTDGMFDYGSSGSSLLWSTLRTTMSLTSMLNLFSVIIAAGVVASEFGKGTIKFLLIAPAARWKILLSKYVCLLLNTALMLGVLFLANLLFGLLFCGAGDLFKPMLTASAGVVRRSSPFLAFIGYYLLGSVSVIVTATLAFAVSSLFRNAGAAICISLLVLYGGNIVNTILFAAGADWGRYLIFANLDLAAIAQGSSYYSHQSIGVAVVILLLHMAVFLLTAFDAFDRREV